MPISDQELIFKELIQTYWDTFANNTKSIIQRAYPTIFISYAWPSQRYDSYEAEKDIQLWLLELYERLTDLGAKVLFDIKTMTLGTNIDQFMRDGVESCDIILVIGTKTYRARSEENTNVKREVEHIQKKVKQCDTGCVIPVLYHGEFHNALPHLGQILGVDCSNEFLYQENLPSLIESIFKLDKNQPYSTLKQNYITQLQHIKTHGLSEEAVANFAQNRAQKARNALDMQRSAVALMLERNAKEHPDYIAHPIGMELPSVKLLSTLKGKYSSHTHVEALFGNSMPLEGQYINVQMLYKVLKREKEASSSATSDTKFNEKEFQDTRVTTSLETIFSKKEPLEIDHLFTPAQQLLTDKQKSNEARPELPPKFILLQGRAGIGKTTFVNFITREWSLGRLWQEYGWVFSLRFRDLRNRVFQQASEQNETWRLEDWIYAIHFSAQIEKATFLSLWTWIIEPDLKNKKVLFILDGYDEMPNHHPCEQALSNLLNSDIPKILTSRPYGLSTLPKDRRELEIVGFIDENVDKYVNLYFSQNQNKAKSIITGLKTSPLLWGNAHIPVTLNILCGVLEIEYDPAATLTKLNTMSGLYEALEMSLLERAYCNTPGKEKENSEQLKLLDKSGKKALLCEYYKIIRQCLGKIAFESFSKHELILTPEAVNAGLNAMGIPVTERSAKIKELLELGLLKKVIDEVTSADTNYEFLHLTFQEYYSSHYLLWQVEDSSSNLLEIFSKIKLDPRYQIVLWFIAGHIQDKEKFNYFMRAIAAPQGGDMLGNMQLSLIVRCTEENWLLAQQTGWTRAITQILQHRINGLWKRYKHDIQWNPSPTWLYMLKISRRYEKQTDNLDLFFDTFAKAKSFETHKQLLQFIQHVMLATPIILDALAKFLSDKDYFIRQEAIEIVREFGAAAATKAILSALDKLQLDDNKSISEKAIVLTSQLDPGNKGNLSKNKSYKPYTNPTHLPSLAPKLLTPPKPMLQDNSVKNEQHTPLTTPFDSTYTTLDSDLLMKKILYTNDKHAIAELKQRGAAAVTPELLSIFIQNLSNASHAQDGAYTTVNIIKELGAAVATPDFLKELIKLLKDEEYSVYTKAAEVIGVLGPAAVKPNFIEAIINLLNDTKYSARIISEGIISEGIISRLGDQMAIPSVMIALCKHLNSSAITHLSNLTNLYLCNKENKIFPDTPLFTEFASSIILGAYLAGNISFNIGYNSSDPSYYLHGFADKTSFNILITHEQAQWFIYWTPKIIHSLENGSTEKYIEIKKNSMKKNSQATVAWFDQLQNNRPSSSDKDKESYGFPSDAVLTEMNNRMSDNKGCVMM
jgi:hypothetical protein